MKRIFVALILIAFALSFCFLSDYTVEKGSDKILLHLQQIRQAIEEDNRNQLTAMTESLEKEWESIHDVFGTTLENTLIEDLNTDILSLGEYIRHEYFSLALIKIRESEIYLKFLRQWHKVTADKLL